MDDNTTTKQAAFAPALIGTSACGHAYVSATGASLVLGRSREVRNAMTAIRPDLGFAGKTHVPGIRYWSPPIS